MAVNKIRRNGSYAPLSAHYYKDDAIDEAGPDAELLFVRGLAFCADVLSDGFISDRQLVRFPGVGLPDIEARAERLVAVGLWDRVAGGYRVRSWLGWNRSRDEITDYQAKDRARKSKKDGPQGVETGPGAESEGASARIPNGNRAESDAPSEWSPNGFHPRARTPRNSTPRKEKNSSSLADASDEQRADVEGICERLCDRIEANGLKRPTITAEWRKQARLLLDADKRDLDQVRRLIDWCQRDPFWLANILSMAKFRKQYDQLLAKARQEQRGGRPAQAPQSLPDDPAAAFDDLRRRAAARQAAAIAGLVYRIDPQPPSDRTDPRQWERDRNVEWIDQHGAQIKDALVKASNLRARKQGAG